MKALLKRLRPLLRHPNMEMRLDHHRGVAVFRCPTCLHSQEFYLSDERYERLIDGDPSLFHDLKSIAPTFNAIPCDRDTVRLLSLLKGAAGGH